MCAGPRYDGLNRSAKILARKRSQFGDVTLLQRGKDVIQQTKSFLAALPTLTATYTGFVNGDTAASLDTPATLSTTATVTSPVGTYPITVTGAADLNYTITFVNGTMTVVDLSPQISIAGISGGDVTLHITCQPGTTLDVEQTTDFVTWTQITQLNVATGAAVYVDVGGGTGAQKFYRLKVVQ